MEVRTINARRNAEEDVIRCARGDYLWGSVHEDERSLSKLLKGSERLEYDYDVNTNRSDALEERMAKFFRKRMNERHWGVWEHPGITLEITGLSRSGMAQLLRHRHLTADVMSNRYVNVSDVDKQELFIYPPSFTKDEIVTRDGVREIDMSAEERVYKADKLFSLAIEYYSEFTEAGVPPEDARFMIPMGQATNLRISGNARALMHLLNVRLNANVQWEAHNAMEQVLRECKHWMPHSFNLFEDMRPIPLAP